MGEGEGPFPSYRAHIGLRGERGPLEAHNPKSLNMLIEVKVHKERDFPNRFPKREEPIRKPKEREENMQRLA